MARVVPEFEEPGEWREIRGIRVSWIFWDFWDTHQSVSQPLETFSGQRPGAYEGSEPPVDTALWAPVQQMGQQETCRIAVRLCRWERLRHNSD